MEAGSERWCWDGDFQSIFTVLVIIIMSSMNVILKLHEVSVQGWIFLTLSLVILTEISSFSWYLDSPHSLHLMKVRRQCGEVWSGLSSVTGPTCLPPRPPGASQCWWPPRCPPSPPGWTSPAPSQCRGGRSPPGNWACCSSAPSQPPTPPSLSVTAPVVS